MEKPRITLPPFYVEVEGARALILEVSRAEAVPGDVWYIVSTQLEYKGIRSKTFTLQARSEEDLLNKLKMEVTKLKFMELAYGTEFLRRVMT